MTCLYPYEDGAYVLGALAPAERADYERHLSTCDPCRASVATLAVLPGLLGRLDAATVAATIAPTSVTAPPTLLPRTLAAVATHRRAQRVRRRWLAVAASVLVFALATATGVGVRVLGTQPTPAPPTLLTAMQPLVQGVPMTAEIGLIKMDRGTDVEMQCHYGNGYSQQWVVKLVVYPRTAVEGQRIGTWTAESDQNWSLRTHTGLSPDQIGRIELQRGDGVPLFTWSPS